MTDARKRSVVLMIVGFKSSSLELTNADLEGNYHSFQCSKLNISLLVMYLAGVTSVSLKF